MSGWRNYTGTAIALDVENIDTDQLIPARFMSTPRAQGYGGFLLHDMRFDADGTPVADAPLNRHPGASVLVTQRNFGTGSSREAAVYALVDFGIRAVIAPSFGDIFAANAVNNGLLPARVAPEVAMAMIAQLGDDAGDARLDLTAQTVTVAGHTVPFTLDPVWREKLINGWDDIDLTAQHAREIAAHRARASQMQPWAFPSGETAQ